MEMSAKSRLILALISEGHTYEQILRLQPELTYKDILSAPQEALDIVEFLESQIENMLTNESDNQAYQDRINKIRKKYPRAYEKWTDEEDQELKTMFESNHKLDRMASKLQRKPGAVRSRLRKLELVDD
jgi:hypothetical protein